MARVSAIHKKGPRTAPGNYRPISILPVISKILERIVHDQIYDYLSKHKLLAIQQSGFRPKHSTQTSLHNFTEFAFTEIGKGNCVGLVALDLKKTFDTINHDILLKNTLSLWLQGHFIKLVQKLSQQQATNRLYKWQSI